MNHFYVMRFTKGRRLLLIGMFALLLFGFLFMQFNASGSPVEEVALTKGNTDEPQIGLTFNISWGDEFVYDILEQLEKEEVQATFFLNGEWAEHNPIIVEKIAEGKHEIGMLGYRYKSYLEQDIDVVRSDLHLAQETFGKLGLEDLQLLRTPSGHFNEEVLELAETMGLEVVHWTVNPNDWENPGTEVIVDEVMKETGNGDIILLHASDSAKQTAGALETILPGLKSSGFEFVSISELLTQVDSEAEIVD